MFVRILRLIQDRRGNQGNKSGWVSRRCVRVLETGGVVGWERVDGVPPKGGEKRQRERVKDRTEGGRIAGVGGRNPFELSRGRAVFRDSQNGRHPHHLAMHRLEGVQDSNFLRPALFLSRVVRSFVRRSFVVRSYTPSMTARAPASFNPLLSVPWLQYTPLLSVFHHHSCRTRAPSERAQRHRRQLETILSRYLSFQPPLIFSHPVLFPPTLFAPSRFFTASV